MKLDKSQGARKLLHTTVFSQCFSPCGQYLAACDNYGKISIFSLSKALAPDASEENWQQIFSFQASEDGALYCLAATSDLLISAGNGPICAWKWKEILDKNPHIVWSFTIPKKGPFSNPEVNSLIVDKQELGTTLFAGCGDKNVYGWDLESGTQVLTLSGHTDYIHDISIKNDGNTLASASEDGSVNIWDIRDSAEPVHSIVPHKIESCGRPSLGKWIGCVDMDSSDDWLVCGGGPKMSLWHLRSMTTTTVFDTPKVCQQTVQFYEDTIISAGMDHFVNHWFVNGELKAQVPCTPTSVFNVCINNSEEKYKVLSVSGSSYKIDICTNFGYRAFSFVLSPD
ncbi:THO complex subunit 6 homolog [Saccostrea cucullata]|uniref:THO complex subunit 6 homolog n=1 Tax=Saccostrea cuccullata TaxID=36930 RepID=UPI002ED13E6F